MPQNLTGAELETYLRNAVTTYWHESGTAKMGRDRASVVDAHLNVYGIDNLRVADDHAPHHERQHHGSVRGDR